MQESSPFVCFLKSADMNLYSQTLDLISGGIKSFSIILVQRKREKNETEMGKHIEELKNLILEKIRDFIKTLPKINRFIKSIKEGNFLGVGTNN